jgi:hypothetical protein
MQHRFDSLSEFCVQCGAHRRSLATGRRTRQCLAGPTVIAISHILVMRRLEEWSKSPGCLTQFRHAPRGRR